MGKKIVKYVPPPLPDLSSEEVVAREAELREQIDSWGYLQGDPPDIAPKNKLIALLFPPRKRRGTL